MAGKTANTFTALNYNMGVLVKNAIKLLEPEILELARKIVEEVVYNAGTPKEYERTMQIRDSLVVKVKTNRANTSFDIEIKNDFSKIKWNAEKFQHGSTESLAKEDADPNIVEIITEGRSGAMFGRGYWLEPRPYIDVIREKLVTSGWLTEQIQKKISW